MATYDLEQRHAIIDHAAPWYKTPSLIKLYALMLSALVTSTSWGFDISMTNSLQSVDTFMNNFGNPTGARLGFYGASSSVGGIVACLVGGWVVDRFGRRALCFIGSAIVIGMAIMETFSTSFHMFTAAKLLLGFGANLQQIGGPVLVTELAHPKQRVAVTSLYNTSIYIGLICGAWITYGTFNMASNWSWRIPCILQVAFPTYQLCMIWFCPESPRWLVSKGREQEARAIFIKYHGNGVEDEVVRNEFQEVLAGVEADRSQVKFNKQGIMSLIGRKGNLHRLWIAMITAVASQCSGSGLISAYLPDVLDQVGLSSSKDKTLINGVINIWTWIVGITAALIIPKVKRRWVFLFSTSGMLATFVVWTALAAQYLQTKNKSEGIGVVAMIFVFNLFYGICWLPMVVTYPLETVTTKQRGVFYAWTMFCINTSGFIVTYINPIGLANISWKYYVIQTIFIGILLVIIYFTFVETHGLTLEEVATVFDGDEQFTEAATAVGAELDRKASVSHVEFSAEKN